MPIAKPLKQPIILDNTFCQYHLNGIYGSTAASVNKAFEALTVIPDINPRLKLLADLLHHDLKTGHCIFVVSDAPIAPSVYGESSGYWRFDSTLKNLKTNTGLFLNTTLQGPCITIFTKAPDLKRLATIIAHEGFHHFVFRLTGNISCNPLNNPLHAYKFYANYIEDCAYLPASGVRELIHKTPAGLLFKAPREYFNQAFMNRLPAEVRTTAQVHYALEVAEISFYRAGSEKAILRNHLQKLMIPEQIIDDAFSYAMTVRNIEFGACRVSAEMIEPGSSKSIMPKASTAMDEILFDLMKQPSAKYPVTKPNNSNSITSQKFDSKINPSVHESISAHLAIKGNTPNFASLSKVNKFLHVLGKTLQYGSLPGLVAVEYYLNKKPLNEAIADGTNIWSIDFALFNLIAPILGGLPTGGLLALANLAESAPDLITLHHQQIQHFPDISGKSRFEAKQTMDDFYFYHPCARPETIISGLMQRTLRILAASRIYDKLTIRNPRIIQETAEALISKPGFYIPDNLLQMTPEQQSAWALEMRQHSYLIQESQAQSSTSKFLLPSEFCIKKLPSEHDRVDDCPEVLTTIDPNDSLADQLSALSLEVDTSDTRSTEKPSNPFKISSISVGKTPGGASGINVGLVSGAVVSIGITGTSSSSIAGATVAISLPLQTQAFLAALGSGLIVGGVVFAVVSTALLIYEKHLKHVHSKISKSGQNTSVDMIFIENNISHSLLHLQKTIQSGNYDEAQTLETLNGFILHINTKEEKATQRSDYARAHKNSKAYNSYQSNLRALGNLENQIGDLKKTIYLSSSLRPETVLPLRLGIGFGTFDGNTKSDVKTINLAVDNINAIISRGENPANTIDALIQHIKTGENVFDNFNHRKSHRGDISITSKDYVSCQQWDARTGTLNDYVDYLETLSRTYREAEEQATDWLSQKKKYADATVVLQQFTSKGVTALSNYAERFGGNEFRNTMQFLQRAPGALPSALNITYLSIRDNSIAPWQANLARQFNALRNPLGSVGKFSRDIDLAFSALSLTPLSKIYPAQLQVARQGVSLLSNSATTWKAYSAYKAGKSMATFGPLAIDLGAATLRWLVSYGNSDGSLPEDPFLIGYLGDSLKWQAALLLPPNPITGAYALAQMGLNAYYAISGEYHEQAYQNMMRNASYYWSVGDTWRSRISATKLRYYLARYHNGHTYSELDTPVVKSAKIFSYNFHCSIIFSEYQTLSQKESASPDEIKNIKKFENKLIKNTKLDKAARQIQAHRLPIKLAPNPMIHRLQILITKQDIDPKEFRQDFNIIYDEIINQSALEAAALSDTKSALSNILNAARRHFSWLGWQNRSDNTTSAKKYMKHVFTAYTGSRASWKISLSPINFYYLGSTSLSLGDPAQAVKYFDLIKTSDKSNWLMWYELGLAIKQIKQYCQSKWAHAILYWQIKLCLEKSCQLLKTSDEVDITISSMLLEMQQTIEAINAFRIDIFLQAKGLNLYHYSEEKYRQQEWHPEISELLSKEILHAKIGSESQGYHFQPEPTPTDGDCALHALGIKRKQAVKQLLDNKDNFEIRKMVADDIADAIISGSLPEAMQDEGYARLLEQWQAQEQNIELKIRDYAQTKSVFEAYIKHYIAKPGAWLSYPVHQQGVSSSLEAIAKLNQISFMIWQRSTAQPSQLTLVHQSNRASDHRMVHLWHMNCQDGQSTETLNHFCVLKDAKLSPSMSNTDLDLTQPQAPALQFSTSAASSTKSSSADTNAKCSPRKRFNL